MSVQPAYIVSHNVHRNCQISVICWLNLERRRSKTIRYSNLTGMEEKKTCKHTVSQQALHWYAAIKCLLSTSNWVNNSCSSLGISLRISFQRQLSFYLFDIKSFRLKDIQIFAWTHFRIRMIFGLLSSKEIFFTPLKKSKSYNWETVGCFPQQKCCLLPRSKWLGKHHYHRQATLPHSCTRLLGKHAHIILFAILALNIYPRNGAWRRTNNIL